MSPYAFYQFWVNRTDAEVPGLLRVFTFRSRNEITELEREIIARPAARTAQRLLAEDVTTLVHGPEDCARAVAASQALFGQGDLRALDERTLAAALAEVPSAVISAARPAAGEDGPGGDGSGGDGAGQGGLPKVADLMATAGITESKSAARRAIAGGGAYLNNVKVTDPDAVPQLSDLLRGRYLVLRHGKRTVGGIEIARDPARHGPDLT
jgi:tyrosyl-tRNA synthetase